MDIKPFKVEEVKKTYSQDQLESALIDLDDLMARAALPYFVIGETARQMVSNEKLSGDGLHIGIRRNELVPTALSTINTHQPELHLTGHEDGFEYSWQDTPIYVHYIEAEDEFFKRADMVWHNAWEYQIPNPFSEYLKTI
jgi:hypothetical protein